MPALTADRTPDQLVAELERLIGVDWPTVWAGVPEDEERRELWLAGFGWRPLWFQGGLRVRTALGGRLHLASAALGAPVARVDHTVWSARALDTGENAHVTALAEAHWSACLTALRGLLGNPTWNGSWETPGFPELPGPGTRPGAEWRAQHRDPHGVAVWRFRVPQAPVFELRMTLGASTRRGPVPADARIGLACHAPSPAESPRQAPRG
ncbi:hypothetical protein SAMN04487983_100735 [Streptomyces sp. yr375]|uniref:hypothetical protein n=1 Tax=Streptomyces sp. yr375 TaxID=1761906 RepID=UPI0008D719B9|nr:hypothetical protein [Streptomyces sp. yr375]SEQ66941.1 hypothetical protein SAMN04487983_100735 [Streptomyces sp. yr375]